MLMAFDTTLNCCRHLTEIWLRCSFLVLSREVCVNKSINTLFCLKFASLLLLGRIFINLEKPSPISGWNPWQIGLSFWCKLVLCFLKLLIVECFSKFRWCIKLKLILSILFRWGLYLGALRFFTNWNVSIPQIYVQCSLFILLWVFTWIVCSLLLGVVHWMGVWFRNNFSGILRQKALLMSDSPPTINESNQSY